MSSHSAAEQRYPILHQEGVLFFNLFESSVVDLLPELTREHPNFGIIQVRSLPDLAAVEKTAFSDEHYLPMLKGVSDALREAEMGPVMGFNQHNIYPYLSDPTGEIPGGIFLWRGRMVYFKDGPPLEEFRDKYLWGYAQNKYYTTKGFPEILKEFDAHGRKFYQIDQFFFGPEHDIFLRQKRMEQIRLSDIIGR